MLDYDCDAMSWEAYLAFHPDEQWVKVLDNLIRCSCDRSFLYVRQRLRKFDLAHLIPQDLKEIGSKSSELKIVSASEVLLRRLKSHAISREDGSYAAITPREDEDQHFIRFKSADIRSLTEDECRAYACSVCGARIMEARDIRRIEIMHDLEQRDIYKSKEVWWSHLDTAIKWGHEPVHVPTTQLHAVLVETLEGLKAPESVMPAEWCPVNLPETTVVLKALAPHLQAGVIPVSYPSTLETLAQVAAAALMHDLGVQDENELATVLPPKYIHLLTILWTRAVKLLAARTNPGLASFG